MHNLKKAWSLVKANFPALGKLIVVQLVIVVVVGLVEELGDHLFSGFLSSLWSIIFGLIGIIVTCMSVSSGMYLLGAQLVDQQKLTLSEIFTRYFSWFKDHWKLVWKPYFIWNVLVTAVIALFSGIIFGMLGLVFLGTAFSGFSNVTGMEDLEYYLSVMQGSGAQLFFMGILFILIASGIALLSSAVGYRGIYAVTAGWQKKIFRKSPMSECFSLALLPALATVIFAVVSVLIVVFSLMSEAYGLLILIVPAGLIWLIWIFIYGFVAEVKILLDVDENVYTEKQFA